MGAEFDDLLQEHRSFPLAPSLQNQVHSQEEQIYAEADRDPEGFWAKFADGLVRSRCPPGTLADPAAVARLKAAYEEEYG